MVDAAELSPKDIKTISNVMGEKLPTSGSQFTSIQLRISVEYFIVPLCRVSVDRAPRKLKPDRYNMYFKKATTLKPISLLVN